MLRPGEETWYSFITSPCRLSSYREGFLMGELWHLSQMSLGPPLDQSPGGLAGGYRIRGVHFSFYDGHGVARCHEGSPISS